MANFLMSVQNQLAGTIATSAFESDFGALWFGLGEGSVNGNRIDAGAGHFLKKGDLIKLNAEAENHAIRFDLSRINSLTGSHRKMRNSAELEIPAGPRLLRLDQVNFPTGAMAYRHVHAGAGFRVLINGELSVISDDHTEVAKTGHVWFEPANSPVRAVASNTAETTRFIRFMVLPVAYEGKPSIEILSAEDALKPRLQATHRHFDKIV